MEDFVPFLLAKKLKEKGFNYECFGHYFDNEFYIDMPPKYYQREKYVSVPTISQVLKWLREEKNIHFEFVAAAYGYNVIISQTPEVGGTDLYYTHMNDDGPNDGGAWDRFEDAALYCIEYVIDNLI